MTQAQHQLDVRPILRAGGEPLMVIMDAVRGLESGQALRLLATFEPVPLYSVLAKKGFEHAAREIGGGDWEVTFTPTAAAAASRQPVRPAAVNAPDPDGRSHRAISTTANLTRQNHWYAHLRRSRKFNPAKS